MIPFVSFSIAETSDAAAISALTRHVIRTVNAKDYIPQEVEYACTKFSPEYFRGKIISRIFYKATLGHEIVGQGSFGEGKVHTLFVHPIFQRQGIGLKLLRNLERVAIDASVHEITLSSSLAAKSFYEKCGYSFVNIEYGPSGNTFLMQKRLSVR